MGRLPRLVLDKPNLTLRMHTYARRLLFEGVRCVGVEVGGADGVERLHAEHEVIVSAGTIESPKLLQLSGIGDPETLRPLGSTSSSTCRASARTSTTILSSRSSTRPGARCRRPCPV